MGVKRTAMEGNGGGGGSQWSVGTASVHSGTGEEDDEGLAAVHLAAAEPRHLALVAPFPVTGPERIDSPVPSSSRRTKAGRGSLGEGRVTTGPDRSG